MATQTLEVEVVFENGIFRPVNGVPFALSEGQHAKTLVEVTQDAAANQKPRIAGLHAGMGWMSDDFDDELPDSFWLGEE